MTKNLFKQFLRYLGPSVVAMWVFSLYTIVDGIFVSKAVGELALASVNISMPFINLVFAISVLFSTGASTVIAMYLGKKNLEKANEAFSLNLVTITVLAIIITVTSILGLDYLAKILGATPDTIAYVKDYLFIISLFNIFFIVSYSLEVIVKTDGFPFLATIGVIISAIANIVLDYIFVIELGYGVKGAAFATGIAQVLSTVFFLSHFLRKKSTLRFVKFKFDFDTIKRIICLGFPDCTTELSVGIVTILFNQTLLRLIGQDALISYSVICYVNTLILMTMIGITQGTQPLISFYFGSGEIDKVNYLLKMGLKTVLITSIAVFASSILFAGNITSLFINPEETQLFNSTVSVFKLYSISFLFVGFNLIISGFFVAIEKPIYSSIISLGRSLVLVTISLFLLTTIFGGNAIWITTAVSEFVCLVIALSLLFNFFRKKKLNSESEPSPKIMKDSIVL
ncbi:MATE family efflux transporter [Terrisporobacter mayombei]|uniref:Multidrug export protein MepA n=1 Tax=Terrisporobacter mayombei TaxID=1541 RepID=A0ABY9Q212_9FIRM|nr:MATE family efflux transporter [Terrisporobacter mayombei]MCC3867049.1 MATE family efflux transporter [Terrisporobacter mayombei]WMT81309.1 Multidrug export protein MepA [Terrisporobacter mayombei]